MGSNIFRLLDSLRALSGQAGCRLRALHLSDLFSPLPILELTRAIVRALPLLRVLSIRVDHPSQRDNPAVPGNAGPPSHIVGDEEIPGEVLHVYVHMCFHKYTCAFVWGEDDLHSRSASTHFRLIWNLFPL